MTTALASQRLCALAALLLLAPACNIYSVLNGGAGMACDDDSDCDPARRCASGICVDGPVHPRRDAGRFDQWQPDVARRDAAAIDLRIADRRIVDAAVDDAAIEDAAVEDAAPPEDASAEDAAPDA